MAARPPKGLSRCRCLCLRLVLAAVAFGGCVTKSKAEAKARAAFMAGQQQAMARMQQTQAQAQGPSVTVNGEVRNRVVPWTEGLTLAKALVAADYYGAADPGQIIIVHNGIGDPGRAETVAYRGGHPLAAGGRDVVAAHADSSVARLRRRAATASHFLRALPARLAYRLPP